MHMAPPPQVQLKQMEEEKREERKKNSATALPFHKLLSYADTLDWALMALGTLGSIVHGMAQPIGYLLLGKALNAFGENINDPDAMVKAINKVYTLHSKLSIFSIKLKILNFIYNKKVEILKRQYS